MLFYLDKMDDKNNYLNNINKRKVDIDPSMDIVFKRLFRNENNKDILVHFLNDILRFYKDFNFTKENVKFLDKELMAENSNKIFPKNDIIVCKFKRTSEKQLKSKKLIKEKDEELVNIEIKISSKGNVYNESEVYASKLMSHSVFKRHQYEEIPEIIIINILDYQLFDDDIGYRYLYRNEMDFYKGKFYHNMNGKLFDEEMNTLKNVNKEEIKTDINTYNNKLTTIHFIELPKLINNNNNEIEEVSPWIKFLNNPNDQMFINEDTHEIYKKARSELLYLQDDEVFRNLYKKRMLSIITENSVLLHERKKGIEEGIEIERRRNIIKNTFSYFSIGLDLSTIKKYSKLSEREIILIDEFLKEPNRNIMNLALNLKIDKNDLNDICDASSISYEDRKSKKIKI